MDENKRVVFRDGTKPPNNGAMKIQEVKKTINVSDKEDINLIMLHTNVTCDVATRAYIECEEDIVNAIIFIMDKKH